MGTGLSAKNQPKSAGKTAKPKMLPKFNDELFLGGVEGLLREAGFIKESVKRDDSPAYWDALGEFSKHIDGNWIDKYPTSVDGLNDFADWLSTSGYEYQEPVLYVRKSFTMTLTMQASSGQISVGMECELEPGVDLSVAVAHAKLELQTAVIEAFPQSAKSTGKQKLPGKTESKPTTESVDFDTLRVQTFNDKLVARLIPTEGKWTQFGAALYKDIADKFGIDIPKKPGDYELSGNMTYELSEGGKPKRVIDIELEEEEPDREE